MTNDITVSTNIQCVHMDKKVYVQDEGWVYASTECIATHTLTTAMNAFIVRFDSKMYPELIDERYPG